MNFKFAESLRVCTKNLGTSNLVPILKRAQALGTRLRYKLKDQPLLGERKIKKKCSLLQQISIKYLCPLYYIVFVDEEFAAYTLKY